MANFQTIQNTTGGYRPQGMPTQYYYPTGGTAPSYDNNYMGANPQNFYNQSFLKCRPVSSREEAMASQIDLDGSLWVFTDLNNGRIYTKQINSDGTASFNTYGYMKEQMQNNSSNYVTKEEFNRVIESLTAAIGSSQNQSGSINTPSPQSF